jgi:hypothetical protein
MLHIWAATKRGAHTIRHAALAAGFEVHVIPWGTKLRIEVPDEARGLLLQLKLEPNGRYKQKVTKEVRKFIRSMESKKKGEA